jgi:hypothetical protein
MAKNQVTRERYSNKIARASEFAEISLSDFVESARFGAKALFQQRGSRWFRCAMSFGVLANQHAPSASRCGDRIRTR